MTLRLRTIALASLLLAAVPATVLAQPPDAPAEGKPGKPSPAEREQKKKEVRAKVLRKQVGLSEERAKKVETVLDGFGPQQKKIREQVREARDELKKLFDANSEDQQAYERALAKLRTSHKSLAELREKQFEALKKDLTPKEQAKLLRALNQARKAAKGGGKGGKGGPGKGGRGGGRGKRGGNEDAD